MLEEETVTRPPPELLKTTAPLLVSMGVADAGVVGGTTIVVGGGTEEVGEVAGDSEVGTVPLFCRFAIWMSRVASGGFSECTCSIALRSLLKTPS